MAISRGTSIQNLATWIACGLAGIGINFVTFGLLRDIEAVEVLSPEESATPPTRVGVRHSRPLSTSAWTDPRSVKVMTYNLNHTGRGNHNDPSNDLYFPPGTAEWSRLSASVSTHLRDPSRVQRNLEVITQFIRRQDPDILFLQEVDRSTPESMWVDTGMEIVHRTGYPYAVWGPKWTMICGIKYITGNAILSKYPIVEAENIALNPVDLPHGYRQLVGVHSALSATIEVNGQRLSCLNTHLYSKKHGYDKKAEQVERLVELVRDSPYPVIVGGDLNTSIRRLQGSAPSSLDPTLRILAESGLIDMRGIHDDDTLDYIFLRAGDPTGYLEMYKLPPVLTDHYINISLIAIPASVRTPRS